MPNRWTPSDIRLMTEALRLARRGLGRVEPNPMVGCVIVKNGKIVGRGYHKCYGGPHAEIFALGEAGRRAKGATVYVTLEPCAHFGKTPPCTKSLIAAGVKHVIAAMKDPNPLVSGRGFKLLRAEGIKCDIGLLERDARQVIAPFIKFQVENRPYVTLKWAQSLDGKIATRTGDSRWITSIQSRRAGHALRARVDGIIVGIATVLADDPELTARLARPLRTATRIVLDTHIRTPLNSKLVRSAREVQTLIVTAKSKHLANRRRRLAAAGCDIVELASDHRGIRLDSLLHELHYRGMTNVLVEGGGRVLGAFVEQKLADEAQVFLAPRLIGGENALGPLRNLGPTKMTDLPTVKSMIVEESGPDWCYTIRFEPHRP